MKWSVSCNIRQRRSGPVGVSWRWRKYGRDRLVAACVCADQKLQYGYQALREVLELGEDADFLPDEDGKVQPDVTSPTPLTHKNIRGREYYRKDKQ